MIFPPFPEPGFRKLSDLQSGIDSYYTADQLKKYGLKCVEEYKRCQSKQEWDIRGDLASSLKCWHRLTGAEAAELVEFTRDRLEGVQQVQEPLSLEQIVAIVEAIDDTGLSHIRVPELFTRAIECAHGIGVSK